MNAFMSTVDTPVGPFTIVVNADGAVLASGFTADTHELLLSVPAERKADLGDATKAALAYFEGDLTAIDTVPVRQTGGPFIAHAWDVLREVPAGEPITYTEFAALAGNPVAVRAAAQACARNAAALFVPCHRVLRRDGTLGGFRYGLPIKRWLLDHEAGLV